MPAAALLAIPALAQAVFGTWQTLNAIKQAKRNVRPEYGQWGLDTARGNLDILNNTMGLPSAALNMLYNRNGQATSQGIDAILANGGNSNMIAGLIGNQFAANENIGLQDAMIRKQDIGNILNARTNVSNEQDKLFQLNQLNPWKDKALAIYLQKNAGIQNIGGAFNAASSAFATGATNKLADSLMKMAAGDGSMDAGGTAPGGSVTTPGSGVNINKIYQQFYGNRQSPFINPNNMTIGNIGQAPQYNFNNTMPFNMNNAYPFFNPSAVSLATSGLPPGVHGTPFDLNYGYGGNFNWMN